MGSKFSPRSTLQKTPKVCEKNYPPGSRPAVAILAGTLPGITHLWYNLPPIVGFSTIRQEGFITLLQVDPLIATWQAQESMQGGVLTWSAGFDSINQQIQIDLLNPPDPIARLYVQNQEYEGPWPQFDSTILQMQSTILAIDQMTVVRWVL